MPKQPLNGVLQHIRKVAAVHSDRGLSDHDLLERFVGVRDEAAFTALIERHGPMVLGVCRRALSNSHDAEDACQATFLVLARKAASVRKRTSLSSWVHGVACRVAASLKRDHARRRARERGVELLVPEDPAAEVTWREVQSILDEELERLPERYRGQLILCYLECMTRDEAAQQLGLSPGRLHGRLERARELLRKCLTKRGLTLSAVMTAAALGESATQAALAPTFVVISTRAALLLATGQPLVKSVVATNVLTRCQFRAGRDCGRSANSPAVGSSRSPGHAALCFAVVRRGSKKLRGCKEVTTRRNCSRCKTTVSQLTKLIAGRPMAISQGVTISPAKKWEIIVQ
jgi:RNA polymerase sigma factor (sigma-70 family)